MIKALVGGAGACILAIVFLPVLFFGALTPSGGPKMETHYERDTRGLNRHVHWLDVYMFDYIKYQNDFQKVTKKAIEHDVQLFYYYKKVPNPNYNPNAKNPGPPYILKIFYRSLEEVMTMEGYTHQQYILTLHARKLIAPLSKPVAVKTTVQELRYTPIPAQELYQFVHQKGSIFTLSDIKLIETEAKITNVNPALLIAITGQEESFVPTSWGSASQILKNPFNVEAPGQTTPGNWSSWSPGLGFSAAIAGDTIANKLRTPPPKGEDPIAWINDPANPDGAYAQDPNWSYGVSDIFGTIESYLGHPLPSAN